ncbi:hypothetical protein R5R35_008872 [Gryllus longicercus]|uniref:Uncharacterized protein n=1 Tax=Gryllus longicercus TaxID=2509291 RepID=A0AAN9VAN6_9ORTH
MPLLNGPLLNDAATGTSLAYPVPQCLLSPAYISYPTRPHWPQRHLLDVQLGKLAQAGIFTKLDSDMWMKFRALGLVHRGPALSTSSSNVPTPEEPRPLQLSALHEPTAVLCVGTFAAAMTFLVEMAFRMRACRLLVKKSRLFLRLRSAEPPRWALLAY